MCVPQRPFQIFLKINHSQHLFTLVVIFSCNLKIFLCATPVQIRIHVAINFHALFMFASLTRVKIEGDSFLAVRCTKNKRARYIYLFVCMSCNLAKLSNLYYFKYVPGIKERLKHT